MKSTCVAAALLAVMAIFCSESANSSEVAKGRQASLLAVKTVQFEEKEGFERRRIDIINTLKDNDVAQFSTLLDGLTQAYDLDKTLKGNGPFTLFAPTDKAFSKMPDDDRQSLWANKKKLKQVLQYHIVPGLYGGTALRSEPKLKTEEGHSLNVSKRGNDLYVDKAQIIISDLKCSNGTIHIIDQVIMPPLSK